MTRASAASAAGRCLKSAVAGPVTSHAVTRTSAAASASLTTSSNHGTDDASAPSAVTSPLTFTVKATAQRARMATLAMKHFTGETPCFMPVGTQGTVKGLTPAQLTDELDCHIILGNTYHLGSKPGMAILRKAGGLHEWAKFPRNMLTDSGGFQMVSLLKFTKVSEEGVAFEHPETGAQLMMAPEMSVAIQNAIGADFLMVLDDVVAPTSNENRIQEAAGRTTRWLDRCIKAHARPADQVVVPIVQGGIDLALRKQCLDDLLQRSTHAYAIGGLCGGEAKDLFWRVVGYCCERLPTDKPRYVMGVGVATDLVVCVCLGADMFDCVFPTRTGVR